MATFTKVLLSGSTQGSPIHVTSTAGGNTICHVGSTNTNVIDEVYLWGLNNGTADYVLHLEWATSATNARISTNLPPKSGPILVSPGLTLSGNSNTSTNLISAFTQETATLSIALTGYVNRIDNS